MADGRLWVPWPQADQKQSVHFRAELTGPSQGTCLLALPCRALISTGDSTDAVKEWSPP